MYSYFGYMQHLMIVSDSDFTNITVLFVILLYSIMIITYTLLCIGHCRSAEPLLPF